MADQDFNIKVVTTADTTGIRQTSRELEQLKNQQASFAETARRQAASAAAAAKSPSVESGGGGITGTAVGIGTIITLLTAAVSKWKAFSDEQDRWVDGMIKAQEKSRELGLAVADMLDAMQSAERIDTEPLQVSFDRLTQKVRVLKTEMQIAFGAGEYEEVKRIASALGVVESQVNRVTSALKQQAEEANKSGPKQQAAQAEAYGAATPQAKAILENEKRARETGDQAFQKTADQFRKSATPADLASLQAVTDAYPKEPRPGRAAEVGESQDLVDEQERQRIAAEAQNKLVDQAQDQPVTPLSNPPPKDDMSPTPRDTYQGGDKTIGAQGSDIIKAIVNLEKNLLSVWR